MKRSPGVDLPEGAGHCDELGLRAGLHGEIGLDGTDCFSGDEQSVEEGVTGWCAGVAGP
jgi:hypothetical protein